MMADHRRHQYPPWRDLGDGPAGTAAAQPGAGTAGAQALAARAAAIARMTDRGAPARPATRANAPAAIRRGRRARPGAGRFSAGDRRWGCRPCAQRALRGDSETASRLNALLAIVAGLDDTCVLSRGGRPPCWRCRPGAAAVLAAGGVATLAGPGLRALEATMLALNVSPGGAADLLAATLLLDRLDMQGEQHGNP